MGSLKAAALADVEGARSGRLLRGEPPRVRKVERRQAGTAPFVGCVEEYAPPSERLSAEQIASIATAQAEVRQQYAFAQRAKLAPSRTSTPSVSEFGPGDYYEV